MKKVFNTLLLSGLLVVVCSCTERLAGKDCFNHIVEEIEDVRISKGLSPELYCSSSEDLSNIIINDSLLFAFVRGRDHICYVSNINNDSIVGAYCPKGRAWNEMLVPSMVEDTYSINGDLCCPIFSIPDSKVFIWNVSQSLKTGDTRFNKISQIADGSTAIYNVFMLDAERLIAFNSKHNPYIDELEEPPYFEVYDCNTGNLLKRYEIFKMIEGYGENPLYNAKDYLSCHPCIKPDRTKIAYVMSYHPQLNILDIEGGNVKGYSIKGAKSFNPNVRYLHFSSVKVDDDYIYALYYGGEFNGVDPDKTPDILYVFDWNGEIKAKFKLPRHFTSLWMDDTELYLTFGPENDIYVLHTNDIKAMLK